MRSVLSRALGETNGCLRLYPGQNLRVVRFARYAPCTMGTSAKAGGSFGDFLGGDGAERASTDDLRRQGKRLGGGDVFTRLEEGIRLKEKEKLALSELTEGRS